MNISCYLKTSLKIHKKENHFKKITVSGQFSIREIGNFLHGSAERHGQDTVVVFKHVNYRHAGQRCLLPLMLASAAFSATLSMPIPSVISISLLHFYPHYSFFLAHNPHKGVLQYN